MQTNRDLGRHLNLIWSKSPTISMVTPTILHDSSHSAMCTSQFLTNTSDTIPTKSFSAPLILARTPRYGGSYAHKNWEGTRTETRSTLPMSSLWKKSDDGSGRTPMPRSSSPSGSRSARAISLMETCSSSNSNHSHSKQEFLALI